MPISAALLALQYSDAGGPTNPLSVFLLIGFVVFIIAAMWRTYEKAGEPGWAAIIPIYAQIVQARIGGKSGWWVVALFVPVINFIAHFVLAFGVAERFNKTALFGAGLALLPFIFYPLLAFGDAEAQPRYA